MFILTGSKLNIVQMHSLAFKHFRIFIFTFFLKLNFFKNINMWKYWHLPRENSGVLTVSRSFWSECEPDLKWLISIFAFHSFFPWEGVDPLPGRMWPLGCMFHPCVVKRVKNSTRFIQHNWKKGGKKHSFPAGCVGVSLSNPDRNINSISHVNSFIIIETM